MPFDLQTILVLRLCVELVVAGAFVVQARRHPTVGGPGWWAAAVVFSTLGSLGFGLRIHSLNLLTVSVANTLLCGAALFAWLGLRSYLGLHRSLRWTVAGMLAILLGQVLFYVVWDSAPARQALLLVLFFPFLVVLSWHAGFEETFSWRDDVLDALSLHRLNPNRRKALTESRLSYLLRQVPRETREALEPFGHYDPKVVTELVRDGEAVTVIVQVEAGEPVRVRGRDLRIDGPAGEDPAISRRLERLRQKLGRTLAVLVIGVGLYAGGVFEYFSMHVMKLQPHGELRGAFYKLQCLLQ